MIELPLVFLAGILGSSHCIGMCGPFAITIGSQSPSLAANLYRQFVYSVGRIFTYATLGAAAGFCGWKLAGWAPSLVRLPALLSVVAGGLLLYYGLLAAGVIPATRRAQTVNHPCLAGTLLAGLLTTPAPTGVFLAGLFTGFLPCGLVYALLAMAASSSDALTGLATMAIFGLGTLPLMVVTGCSSTLFSLTARRYLYRIAAWCVVMTGAITMARGFGFLHLAGLTDGSTCPLCH